MSRPFELIAPPHAPFHADGSLNLDMVERLAAHYASTGIAGVFVSGTTGESQSLTVPERLLLAQRWIDVCRGTDLHVIIQVGHNCVADATEMAAHAQRSGAESVASLAPSFLKPASVSDLIASCQPVAAAAPDLPFYLYDIPTLTNVRLPMPEFLAQGRERIPNLRGLKYTNADLVQLQECLHVNDGEFEILFGCDEILLTGVLLGCPGAVGSTYNFVAEHCRTMVAAFFDGDLETARRGQRELVGLIRILQTGSFLPASKWMMSRLGLDCGPVRAPLTNLSAAATETLSRSVEAHFAGTPLLSAVR